MPKEITFFKTEEQKVKYRFDKTLAQIITGQIVMQRRTTLPCLTIGSSVTGSFNVASKSYVKDFSHCTFYKLANGMIFVEFGNTGVIKISRHEKSKHGTGVTNFSATKLKKYIFNELKNQKLIYHFYLHPTDKPNMYLLRELTNSWE